MKTTPRIISALAIAGALVTTVAQAAETGPYIRLENGVNSISGADLRLQSTTVTVLIRLGYDENDSQKLKFNEGYIFGGAVGYSFGESFSTEIELDHAENKVDTIGGYSVQNSAVGDFLGQSSVTFKQTNLLVSGIYSPTEGSQTSTVGGVAYTLSGKSKSDAAFLAQLKTGVSIALAKNFTFDAGYKLRFVGSTDVYEATLRSTPLSGSERFTVDSHLNHVFSAGFTYSF